MMLSGEMKLILVAVVVLLGVLLPARASVIVVAPKTNAAGSLTITQDITFTITSLVPPLQNFYFVFDEWVSNDQTVTQSNYLPLLSISKNGATPTTYGTGNFLDNYNGEFNGLTANDGWLSMLSGPSLAINDTVTLKAASYSLTTLGNNFNPQVNQTFSGNMFLAIQGGGKVSNTVSAVPEPASCAFLAAGALALLARRRPATK